MYSHVLRSAAVLLAVSGVTFTAALSPGSIFERTLAAGPSAISLKDADSVPLNSPGIIERSMCLTISLLKSAAYECGGLRIVHQLPSVRVLGKAQIPTLVWNSERANPFPQIALDVSLPSGTSIPDKIRYVVKVAGTPRDSVEISNSQLTGIGSNRKRITVSWDAWSDATGVYPVTVDAVSFYGSTFYTTSVNTEVIVINDRSSPFGQGWWLAGFERIVTPAAYTADRLWIGGDGSARWYRNVATNTWVADAFDRPDTLFVIGSAYKRRVSGGDTVEFDANGRHTKTIDSRGYATTFSYVSSSAASPVSQIALPNLASKPYSFFYTTSGSNTVIDSVVSSNATGRRLTRFLDDGRAVSQIFDPDGSDVSFEFDVSTRIVKHRNRHYTESVFAYNRNSNLTRMVTDLTARKDTTTICPVFAVADSVCTATRFNNSGSTAIVDFDGPRTGTIDVAAFRVERFGNPSWIRNPHGDSTNIRRDSVRFPAFVSRLREPGGLVTRYTPDSAGNVATVTVENAIGDGNDRTTGYEWDARFDQITKVTQPLGDYISSAYDNYGNLSWRGDSRGDSSKTYFYYNTDKLLETVRYPVSRGSAVDKDYLTYDALGNVNGFYQLSDSGSITNRYNASSHYTQDAIGRTGSTCVDLMVSGSTPPHRCTFVFYDIMGRDSSMVVESPTLNSITGQYFGTTKIYGPEGQLLWLIRERSGSSTPLTTYYTYDNQQNLISEIGPDAATIYYAYDEAGNRIRTVTRRGDTLTMSYDGMNRLTQRIVPAVSYNAQLPANSIGDLQNGSMVNADDYYPWTTAGGGFYIPAETTSTFYDTRGQLDSARNTYTSLYRKYRPNGLLWKDSLRVQSVHSATVYQSYGLENRYDGNGRRTSLRLPSALLSGSSTDSIGFQYTSATNELWKVTDPNTKEWTYQYSWRGDVTRLSSPGSRQQNLSYDGVGNVNLDELLVITTPSNLTLRRSHSTYDPTSRRLSIIDTTGFQERSSFLYSGMGYAISSQSRSAQPGTTFATGEHPAYDGLGNITAMNRADSLVQSGGSQITSSNQVGIDPISWTPHVP